jgi:predicted kinase
VLGTLVVVGGLPGAGKSTLADALAAEIGAPVFNKDRLEASLWRDGITADRGSWEAAEHLLTTLAGEQLRRGQSAILDTVARRAESRAAWRAVADEFDATYRLIECVCTDPALHRRRIEGRTRGIPGWYELAWDDVEATRRRAEPWVEEHLVLDAVRPLADNLASARSYIA